MSKDKKLVINLDVAESVKVVFDVYTMTRYFALVYKELEFRGIKTRSGKEWQRKSSQWFLSNPIYVGKLIENDKCKTAFTRRLSTRIYPSQ